MFCPQCKAEYQPGFKRCNDCDVELVDVVPASSVESPHTEDADFVVVATVQGPLEEGQITSFLEANSIPVQVRGEGFRKVYGITINGIGAAQILVPRDLAITALDLLGKADRGELRIDTADAENSTHND
jgi:hypothetical protein